MYLFFYWVHIKKFPYRPDKAMCAPEGSGFSISRHMKVASLSVLPTGRLYLLETSLVLISVRGRVYNRDMVRSEGLCQWKIPIGNRTRDLPACSAVSQPTASLSAPFLQGRTQNIMVYTPACILCTMDKQYEFNNYVLQTLCLPDDG